MNEFIATAVIIIAGALAYPLSKYEYPRWIMWLLFWAMLLFMAGGFMRIYPSGPFNESCQESSIMP